MTAPIMPGAEPLSHVAPDGAPGALVLHGFTGNPSSMRGLAEALVDAGFHVEMPRLPGHGTVVTEMIPTRWADWLGEAEAALASLRERADRVVVAGLSMGGTLTLTTGANHPDVAGLICVNPAAQPQPSEVVAMVEDFIAQGMETMPGIGADIADPDATEIAYPETPLAPLLSLATDGLGPLAERYPDMTMPLLLCTSPQDHVVDPVQSDFLAERYGGPVERVSLERSYHVATQDYDKQLIFDRAVDFARRVTE